MGIDHDIHQSKFRNEYQRAGVNLLYTYGWVMERTKELFASEDITPPSSLIFFAYFVAAIPSRYRPCR